jgi:hypothetical protein
MSGRPKGFPKSGGRTKGTPNKKSKVFSDELESNGFDLAKSIVELFKTTQNESIKLSLIELVTKYKVPVPKSIDLPIESEPQEESEDSTEDLITLIKR